MIFASCASARGNTVLQLFPRHSRRTGFLRRLSNPVCGAHHRERLDHDFLAVRGRYTMIQIRKTIPDGLPTGV